MALTPWHRLFGLGLSDLYHGSPYRVALETDLSVKQQLLDVIIISLADDRGVLRGLERPPDGLEPLARFTLITYKSIQEPLNVWAMNEFLGHYVSYRKMLSPGGIPLRPPTDFQLIAVCTRFPSGLASQVTLTKGLEGVYTVRWGVREIRVVVLSRVSKEPHNALWGLFSGEIGRIAAGRDHYQWRQSELSRILRGLYDNYKKEGLEMPYTAEEFVQEVREDVLDSASMEEILSHVDRDALVQRLSPEERLRGLPPEERLRGLSLDQIQSYLDTAKSGNQR